MKPLKCKQDSIEYIDGYKYQLKKTVTFYIPLYPSEDISSKYIKLTRKGELIIYGGYAWDGPSGPTIDTKNFMRSSLVHDALYQLMREVKLDICYRQTADEILRDLSRYDGMSQLRSWYVYRAVVRCGKSAATDKREVHKAP